MDPDSPFANLGHEAPNKITHRGTVYVNYCTVCHHVWKAPAAATTCINCKGNGECACSLVNYETEAPQI